MLDQLALMARARRPPRRPIAQSRWPPGPMDLAVGHSQRKLTDAAARARADQATSMAS